MSFEALLSELEKNAEAQEEKILKEATTQVDAINNQTKEQIASLITLAKNEAQSLIEDKKAEISTANIQARKIIAEGKNKAIEKTLENIKELLKEYTQTKQYSQLLLKLTNSATLELGDKQNTTVQCRKEDAQLLKKANFNVESQIETIGGAIIQTKDHKIKINSTLENLLLEHADTLRQIAFAELFSKKNNEKLKRTAKKGE